MRRQSGWLVVAFAIGLAVGLLIGRPPRHTPAELPAYTTFTVAEDGGRIGRRYKVERILGSGHGDQKGETYPVGWVSVGLYAHDRNYWTGVVGSPE